jgi:excisionase family DNA binding protein
LSLAAAILDGMDLMRDGAALTEPGEPTTEPEPPELLTAEEAATYLRVTRSWVYEHAAELGGYRLLGDRGRWRFPRSRLLGADRPETVARSAPPPARARRRRPPGSSSTVTLLPITPRLPRAG